MRGHNICFCLEIKKLSLNYHLYPLLSGALSRFPGLFEMRKLILLQNYIKLF